MDSGKIIIGLLAGAAAGAILGILFAPDSGSETRRKISEKGTDLADSLKNKFNEFVDGIADRYEDAGDKVNQVVQQGKEKADQFKGEARSSLS